jgi:hypothetical protein
MRKRHSSLHGWSRVPNGPRSGRSTTELLPLRRALAARRGCTEAWPQANPLPDLRPRSFITATDTRLAGRIRVMATRWKGIHPWSPFGHGGCATVQLES